MPAGPFPTKVMHEALKERVEGLESAPPSGGGVGTISYLSERVALDATGTRTIDPAEIPAELYVRSCILTLDAGAVPLTFSVLEGGLKEGGASLSLSVFANQQDFNNGASLFDLSTDDDYRIILPEPLTLQPGSLIAVAYGQLISNFGGRFHADPAFPEGVSYSVDARDNTGAQIGVPLVGLPFRLLTPGNVLGSLLPDAMNVVDAPSTLANGSFEIVDPGNTAPTLRYRASSGTVYRLAMTPEL